MGSCTSSQKKEHQTRNSFQCEPAGTEDLKHLELPKLRFHASLANVKIKKFPYQSATAYFRVRQGENFTLNAKTCTNEDTIVWKIYEAFDFQMTQYELRKQFLEVAIHNQDNENVARIKINLFLIATGPFHQDFALHFPNDKIGRISFDLKISQIINLTIECQESQIFLNKKHPGEQFCFSIKTINGLSGTSYESKQSYAAIVLLQNKNDDLDSCIPEGLTKRKSLKDIKEIREGGELKWNKDGGELPVIQTTVVASELQNTYFQIIVWKYLNEQSTTKEVFVDTYVSFYKLLGTDPKTFKKGISEYESRSIKMEQKVQHQGKDYGTGHFRFNIVNQTYLKQYQLCIHTEVGILKTNPIFGIEETKTTDKCPELRDILSVSMSLQQNFISLTKVSEFSRGQVRNLKEVVEKELQKIYKLLEKTSHKPAFLYTYSSQRDLLQGQKILVELGVKITQYIQSEDPIAKDLCWLILISLTKRGEFSLSHMGFNDDQKRKINNEKADQLLLFKQEVAIMYKVFLYKLLDHALNSIDHKGSEYQRTFAEVFSAFAYFRIPEFRKQILRLITKDTDPQIIEWRGVDFNLQDDIGQSRIKDKGNTFKQMFDWEQHFYKYLRSNQKIESNSITLKQILNQEKWKDRFLKRGLAFFYFLKYWVSYVESTLPNSIDIQWLYFPGYNRLLRGFFVQLKLRPVLDYPDAQIQAALKLLANQKMLNPMMKIIMNKTNVYDTCEVTRVIEYISLMLQTVGNSLKHRLPLSFNYNVLFKGLTMIFQTDFSIAVNAALTLLYNNFDIFHLQFRRSLAMYLLGSSFNKFFLHWSYNVRYIFYHLIIYRVYKSALLQEDSFDDFQHSSNITNQDILERYEQLMRMLDEEHKKYKDTLKKKFTSITSTLYKQMRFKLRKRFKREDYQYIVRSPSKKPTMARKHYEGVKDNNSDDDKNEQDIEGRIFKCSSDTWTSRRAFAKVNRTELNLVKKDQIKRMTRSNQFSYQHHNLGKRTSLFYEIIPPKEFSMKTIQPEQLKYIEFSLAEFKAIEKACFQSRNQAPEIKPEIAIDKRQIRPNQFDQW